MRVTVAICTWNRYDLLQQTLEGLTHAVRPADMTLEVLVVNNNCTDATDAVIDEFLGRLPLRRVFEHKPGLSHARNAALIEATGEYLIFTDDDVLVDESWLVEFEAATRAYPEAAAFGGIIESWFPEEPDAELLEVFPVLKNGFCGLNRGLEPRLLTDHEFIWGANMAYRLAALQHLRFSSSLGPTPTSMLGGDDVDLIRRLRAAGGTVVWWPMMRVQHYVAPSRMSLRYLLRYVAGKGTELVLLEPEPTVAFLGGIPRWLWRRWARVFFGYVLSTVTPIQAGSDPHALSGPVTGEGSRRVRALRWRRELVFVVGMVRGYRQRERLRRSRGHEAAAPVAPQAIDTR